MINKKILLISLALLILISMGAASAATESTSSTVSKYEGEETTFTPAEINTAASKVKTFVDRNKRLPNYVYVGSQQVLMPNFLALMTENVVAANNGDTTTPIALKNVNAPANPSETIKSGTLTKTEYNNIAIRINKFVTSYGRAPNYTYTSKGSMRYENMIYSYSKILGYADSNNRMPNSVSVNTWIAITSKSNTFTGGTYTFTDTSKTKTTRLGSNSKGYVDRIGPFGTGKNKIAVIIGVHPLEGSVHIAMLNALKTLASKLNNVQIWVYKVWVYDKTDYAVSRRTGEYLAKNYVVPRIDSSYKLALDVHGNRGLYGTNDFVFAPSKGSLSVSYANKIIKTTDHLKYYQVADGSSPKYVTLPIASKGIPAVILEYYTNINYYNIVHYNYCLQVVKGLNTIFA